MYRRISEETLATVIEATQAVKQTLKNPDATQGERDAAAMTLTMQIIVFDELDQIEE